MSVALDRLERIVTPIPGPRSRALAATLARYEPQGVTHLSCDYPVFWSSARGALVTDVDGNRFIDLTAAFGVANVGHTNERVGAAVAAQAHELIHGMGDVHPTEIKALLLERLAALAPGALQKTYLTTGGAEAVEFALKTALLATNKSRFIAYTGGYHGLSLGALDVIGIPKFRAPFAALIAERTTWLPFPGTRGAAAPDREHHSHSAGTDHVAAGGERWNADRGGEGAQEALAQARAIFEREPEIAALIIEPVQGRGGVIVPPRGFLGGLRRLCDEFGAMLIFDEIYTGFGRTGTMFACEEAGVVPDLLCVGKALAGGVPLAATIGKPSVMDAWPKSEGEALHTGTFIGNPLACAAALATLDEIERLGLVARVRHGAPAFGARLERLRAYPQIRDVRGIGYLQALEFDSAAEANRVVVQALARGVILLQSGPTGTSITLAPPLVIDDDQLARALDLLEACLASAPAR